MLKINQNKLRLKYKNTYAVSSSIACGKSTFLKVARENNIFCLDVDVISEKIFCLKWKQIRKKLNIKLDFNIKKSIKEKKRAVGKMIFVDKKAKKKLEKIMHPRIKKEVIKIIKKNKNKLLFVEIPLFFENQNYNFLLNKIVIYCKKNISLERLMNRNNLSYDEALARINSQLDIDYKIKHATYVIQNDGALATFKDSSIQVIKKIKEKNGI